MSKSEIESTPAGEYKLQLNLSAPVWQNNNSIESLNSEIAEIIQKQYNRNCDEINSLRLISVTSDYYNHVLEINSLLGHFWDRPSENGAAKTFTWFNSGNYHSIIVLAEHVAYPLTRKDIDEYNISIATLIHELSHVVDDIRFDKKFGIGRDLIDQSWRNIRRFLARSFWAEYYSEKCASAYNSTRNIKDNIFFSFDILKETSEKFMIELINYQNHLKDGLFWSKITEYQSTNLNQLGRAIGCLSSEKGIINEVEFYSKIEEYSAEWYLLLKNASKILNSVDTLVSDSDYESLQSIVDDSFKIYGFDPYKR